MTLPYVQRLDHGIHAIDTGFHRANFDAAYPVSYTHLTLPTNREV